MNQEQLRAALRAGNLDAADRVFSAWREARGSWRKAAGLLGVPVRTLFRWRSTFLVLRPVRPGCKYKVNDNPRQTSFSFDGTGVFEHSLTCGGLVYERWGLSESKQSEPVCCDSTSDN